MCNNHVVFSDCEIQFGDSLEAATGNVNALAVEYVKETLFCTYKNGVHCQCVSKKAALTAAVVGQMALKGQDIRAEAKARAKSSD